MRELIGRGGHARVYRADMELAEGPTRAVALKVFDTRAGGEDQALRRFRDEAHLLASLQHRAIVGMHDLVELDAGWTIVLDWVPGADVASLIGVGRAPVAAVAAIGAEIADALDHAWRAPAGTDDKPLRLVHRDISARNVRITPAGDFKLLDFGLARADTEREAATTQMLGLTRAYASPERLSGHAQSLPEGDIFSLGLILLDLLRGSHRVDNVAVMERTRRELLQALSAELTDQAEMKGVPELVALIHEMIDFDPNNRPDARSVADRCADLAVTGAGPRLRTWAPQAILRAAQRTTEAGTDSWVGRALSETAAAPRVIEQEATDKALLRRRIGRRSVVLSAVVLILAGGAWVWAFPAPTPHPQPWFTPPPVGAAGEVGKAEWGGPSVHLRAKDGTRYRVGTVPIGTYDVVPDDGSTALCRVQVDERPAMLVWDAENQRCAVQ